ncbi:serine/threonine protein kinase [Williamsia sp.]|uniref:serine/threonine protein kinase n=1 Tax=Williamsia sp. TaxID=1872085 RepID=UPI002F935160
MTTNTSDSAQTTSAADSEAPTATSTGEATVDDKAAASASAPGNPTSEPLQKPTKSEHFREYVNPRKHPVVAGVSLLCVVALVATIVFAVLFDRRSDELSSLQQLNKNTETAETIAGQYAVGAATFSYEDLKPWSAGLKQGTAEELNSRFDVAVTTLTPLIQEVQWSQTATLIAATTVDIRSDRQYVVQVFVSTQMTSTQNPAGLNTITPYTITLDRDDDWLITDVAGIAGTAQDGSTGDGTPDLAPTTPAPPAAPTVPPTP